MPVVGSDGRLESQHQSTQAPPQAGNARVRDHRRRPLRSGSVMVTGISFLFRTTMRMKVFLVRLERSTLLISRVVATLESSILTITSPALTPALSAAEFLMTDLTSTPSLTPKKSANCPCDPSDSPSIPRSGVCQDISRRGTSIGGKGGIGTFTGPLGVSMSVFFRAPTVTIRVWLA